MVTAITNVLLFDGEHVQDNKTVLLEGQTILGIDQPVPEDATIIDGTGCTLLPGLIDAHVHTKIPQLALACSFGITTELEMMGHWTPEQRKEVSERDDIADVRTAEFGMTAPGGHPSELHKKGAHAQGGPGGPPSGAPPSGAHKGHNHGPGSMKLPTANSPEEAVKFVADRVADGADYIKVMIEEGSVLNHPGLPLLSHETLVAAVDAAHQHKKLAIAHALTAEAASQAITAGIDGLAHIFLDGPHTPELVNAIASSKAFVTPCICLNGSIMGTTGKALTADPRVSSRLDKPWLDTLNSSFNTFPQGNIEDVLGTVKALHDAGVDILAGTDASMAVPHLGGVAHGASVHHELQLFVQAGMTPLEALRAATSVPARRFSLDDRGRIASGLRADLLLVEGNPTSNISDTLSIKGIWRRGVKLGA